MDKKYCETLPNLVKGLPTAALSDDENGAVMEATRKKPRKSKSGKKIGKNGLYPEEELNIARWWISRKTSADVQDSIICREEYIKARVLVQRAREIQLQIILILETLALEISMSEIKPEAMSSQTLDKDHLDQFQKPKPKKPKDLNTLLDLLVDRLCIWQSMNADEAESSPKGKHEAAQQTSKAVDNSSRLNNLRAFCIDVVLPL
jgi:DNA replication regulator SLD3